MIFCLIWGFGGALISLALSRVMAKWMMGVQLIDETTTNPQLREVVSMVYRLADQAGLPARPQVGFYESPEVNAFATGPTKSRALVAVSSGLLNRMKRDEVEGVIGHEIAHVANGDMVTMTLIQGVINAFVMFIARVIGYAITSATRSDENERPSYMMQSMVTMVLEIFLSILGSIVVAAFSRWREYRADKGGATLAGRGKMIAALEALKTLHNIGPAVEPEGQKAIAAFKISSRRGAFLSLFSTHPDLDDRIQALKASQVG
jgi:heat shock protein HtpX